jgi:hypothetical protein
MVNKVTDTRGTGTSNLSGAPKFTPRFKRDSCCSIISFLWSVLGIIICPFLLFRLASYIVAVSFIGGGNRSTRRKPQTCRKSLTKLYRIMLYRVHLMMYHLYIRLPLNLGNRCFIYKISMIIFLFIQLYVFLVQIYIFFLISRLSLQKWLIRELHPDNRLMSHCSNIIHSYIRFIFICYLLAIVLSVLLRYADSDYPFGIFKLFLSCLCKRRLRTVFYIFIFHVFGINISIK